MLPNLNLPLALGALTLLASEAAAGKSGGMGHTCQNLKVEGYDGSQWLVADCRNNKGSLHSATIDLGTCFAYSENDGIYFSPGRKGPIDSNCSQYRLKGTELWYQCYLPHLNGGSAYVDGIDLSQYVSNVNGKLACYQN